MSELKDALIVLGEESASELIKEYEAIRHSYITSKWSSVGHYAGRFAEVCYSVLLAKARSEDLRLNKPKNFRAACLSLEQETALPDGLRFLVPRMLSTLYEIRNKRDAGHIAAEIDANKADGSWCFSTVRWIIGEIVRHYHKCDAITAQNLVDDLSSPKYSIVWEKGEKKRVLATDLSIREKIIVLLSGSKGSVQIKILASWVEYKSVSNFKKLLRRMHSDKIIEYDAVSESVELLPPGEELLVGLKMAYEAG